MVTGQDPSASTSRRDLLDKVWRAVRSEHVTTALLLALCASLVVASLLPQPPRSVASESDLLDRWVMTTSSRYERAGPTLAALGMFSIGSSWWFRLISAFAVLHLLVWVADLSRFAFRSLHPASTPPEGPLYSGFTEAAVALSVAAESALGQVRQVLVDAGLSIKSSGAAPGYPVPEDLYAHRSPWSTLAPVFVCLGLLLGFFGAWTDDMWGWHSQEVEAVRGRKLDLGRELAWSVTLARVASAREAGRLAITTADPRTEHVEMALTRPARYRGVSFSQVSSGPALRVSASDVDGLPLTVQSGQQDEAGGVALVFNRTRAEQQVTISEANLALRVVAFADQRDPEMDEPRFAVDAYEGGSLESVYSATVSSSSQFDWKGTTIRLEPEWFATVRASQQPGAPAQLAGALLVLFGLVILLLCPGLQVWARLTPARRATRVRFSATVQGAGSGPEDDLRVIINALGGDDVRET